MEAKTVDVAALARSLDCFTEEELQALANATPGTVEAWRKRGTGPAYARFGTRYLYPRAEVAKHLQRLVRQRVTVSVSEGL